MACRDRVGQLQDEFPSRSPKVDVVEHVLHFTTPLVSRKVTALHPEGRVITYTSNGLYCALACIASTGPWCFHGVISDFTGSFLLPMVSKVIRYPLHAKVLPDECRPTSGG